MSAPAVMAVTGACALSFGAAFAVGTMTRDDQSAARDPGAAPASTRLAGLARAAGLPALGVLPAPRPSVVVKRAPGKAAPRRSTAGEAPAHAFALVQRPARGTTPASRPVTQPSRPISKPPTAQGPRPTASPSKPTAGKPTAASAPAVTFFDDGG